MMGPFQALHHPELGRASRRDIEVFSSNGVMYVSALWGWQARHTIVLASEVIILH